MGDFNVRTILDRTDRAKMASHVLDDIIAMEQLFDQNKFESGPPKIGAEQEICVLDSQYQPAFTNLQLLDKIADPHYTHELAKFNLEVNLDPVVFKGRCFQNLENQLLTYLTLGQKTANSIDNHLLLSGILPTLKFRHLEFANMTPIPRYHALSEVLRELRGSRFELYIQGVDDLNIGLDNMLFEACNTSFQMHLQIDAQSFVDKYNWAQMIAGPMLAVAANSPLLFGNELWAETRIAVFKQSIDTRSAANQMRKKIARVFFGEDWLRGSPMELLREEVQRFPFILTSDNFELSSALIRDKVPELRAIKIHNGTTYTWNRLCYGVVNNQAHLRIECRYLPAGPSPIDEIANMAFWTGLMEGQPEKLHKFWKEENFKDVKDNFFKAARYGHQVVFNWMGKKISAADLILNELIPMAREGLENRNVDARDIEKYLSIIEQRISVGSIGADWQVRSFRNLQKNYSPSMALAELSAQMVVNQNKNLPVHEWKELTQQKGQIVDKNSFSRMEDIMESEIHTVAPDDSLKTANAVMQWNDLDCIIVEGSKGDVKGILTKSIVNRKLSENSGEDVFVEECMSTSFHAFTPGTNIADVRKMNLDESIPLFPVVFDHKLMGFVRWKKVME